MQGRHARRYAPRDARKPEMQRARAANSGTPKQWRGEKGWGRPRRLEYRGGKGLEDMGCVFGGGQRGCERECVYTVYMRRATVQLGESEVAAGES